MYTGKNISEQSSVQVDISLIRCAHSCDIELNTRREIPFARAPIYYSLFIFLRATYDRVLLRRPKVRPKSKIDTPKRDDERRSPFYMGVPPAGVVSPRN